MAQTQSRTAFFESIIGDRNVPAAQVRIFFRQAYQEQEGSPDEQLRLFDLVARHRPELEDQVARSVMQGGAP